MAKFLTQSERALDAAYIDTSGMAIPLVDMNIVSGKHSFADMIVDFRYPMPV